MDCQYLSALHNDARLNTNSQYLSAPTANICLHYTMTHDWTLTAHLFSLIVPSISDPNRQCHCTQQVLQAVLLSTYKNSSGRPTAKTSSRYIPVKNTLDTFALSGCPAALIWLVSVVSGELILKTGRIRCHRNVGTTANCTANSPE